jgi:hypothetical protein
MSGFSSLSGQLNADAIHIERDRTLARAFEGGAYANAYQGEDYALHEDTIAGFSVDYRVAFILGFFATYERNEVPYEHAVAYEEALAHPASERLRALGLLDRCELNITPAVPAATRNALDGTSGDP